MIEREKGKERNVEYSRRCSIPIDANFDLNNKINE